MPIHLQTKIRLPEAPQRRLEYGDKLLSLGSCFSQHIGQYLFRLGHHISVNPFGAVYNPASMSEALARLIEAKPFQTEELFHFNGLYHSRLHHGAYSAAHIEQALDKINHDYGAASGILAELDYLLLTWGSAWIYEDELGVVSNCHKRPERDFVRRLWSVEELIAKVQPILSELLVANPKLQIISTISPIRHLRDTAHGNQLSKATLLLMNEALADSLGRERYHYFPAYEIVLDELRDYRFYAEDMTHPSELTQRLIAESFSAWLISPKAQELGQQVLRFKARQEHRPLHSDYPDAELQRMQEERLLASFREQYPLIRWS